MAAVDTTQGGGTTQRPSSSRQSSAQDRAKLQAGRPSPILAKSPIEYTVVIRLPFPRNDFVDPAPVEWDAVKDKALWRIISNGSDSRNLDWQETADRFDVSLPFLMKQAAWLYERHFAGVRKQMQRLVTTSTPSPVPSNRGQEDGNQSGANIVTNLKRTGSKSSQTAASPSRRDSPLPKDDNPAGPRLAAPPFSRTPSSATITQSRLFTSARNVGSRPFRTSDGQSSLLASARGQDVRVPSSPADAPPAGSRMAQDDSGSENELSMARSQAFRRPHLGSRPTLGAISSEGDVEDGDDDDDDDESSSAGFLPFAAGVKQDPSATLRASTGGATTMNSGKLKSKGEAISSSTSSASSAPPALSSDSGSRDMLTGPKPGPLSQRHQAKLKQLSPRHTQRDIGSDGTPSMGSSFSDLDDAGISASAIEDAVLSTMQAGDASIASRVSGLSQAFRSQK